MASATSTPDLRFAIKDLGDYTHRIGAVAVGAAAVVEGPYGRFSHRFVTRRRQVWIAGGIGIAPFLAMAESLSGTPGYDIDLFYGFPDLSRAPYLDDLTQLAAGRPSTFRVHPVDESVDGFLTVDRIRAVTGSLNDLDVLLCGPPAMMHTLHDKLREAGVSRTRIHFEVLAFL